LLTVDDARPRLRVLRPAALVFVLPCTFEAVATMTASMITWVKSNLTSHGSRRTPHAPARPSTPMHPVVEFPRS
jgi:hypothetical protein